MAEGTPQTDAVDAFSGELTSTLLFVRDVPRDDDTSRSCIVRSSICEVSKAWLCSSCLRCAPLTWLGGVPGRLAPPPLLLLLELPWGETDCFSGVKPFPTAPSLSLPTLRSDAAWIFCDSSPGLLLLPVNP